MNVNPKCQKPQIIPKLKKSKNQTPDRKFFKKQKQRLLKHVPRDKVMHPLILSIPCLRVEIGPNNFMSAYLDTGATCNLISQEIYEKLNKNHLIIESRPSSTQVYAANNTAIEVFKECYVKIKIDNFSWKVKFIVTKMSCVPLILGNQFISKSQLVIDLSQKECYFKFRPCTKINLYLRDHNEYVNLISPNTDIQGEVKKILKEYSKVFEDKIGCALNHEVKIKLKDPNPVNIKPYFMNPVVLNKVQAIIDQLLADDIIETSDSEYSSPVFLTAKDRLVVNYTLVNQRIERNDYPIGNLDSYPHYLANKTYYSVLDLRKSFFQLPLSPESRHITAFSLMHKKFQFKRVSFGLHLGSSCLSQYLDKVLGDLRFKICINYVDDIVIMSEDFASHKMHVRQVLDRLQANNLTVNLDKAQFFVNKVKFLGHIISNGKISIDPDRTESIVKCQPPKDLKSCRRFIGMCSFFNKFIPNFSLLSKPLNDLKRKHSKFVWTEECQKSFESLKNAIISPEVLSLAKFDQPFTLCCDSSVYAIGACLMRADSSGKLFPVSYFSRRFTDCQMKYSIWEKELLAIILAVEKFEAYLELQEFTLITDNESLSFFLRQKRNFGRLARWSLKLLRLPFKVVHKRSEDNAVADTLSRLFSHMDECHECRIAEPSVNAECDNFPKQSEPTKGKIAAILNTNTTKLSKVPKVNKEPKHKNKPQIKHSVVTNFASLVSEIPLAFDSLATHQSQDEECIAIRESIRNKTHKENFSLKNDVVMYKEGNKQKIYLPKSLFKLVFTFYHSALTGSHLGIARTTVKATEYFFNPQLKEFLRNKIKECHICAMSKKAFVKFKEKLVSLPCTEAFQELYIDTLGPLTMSKSQNQYCLVVLDSFTGFVWLFALRNCTSKAIINVLERNIFNAFSYPRIIVSDNAKYFVSHEFKSYCFKNYVKHRTITAYNAKSNKSERKIRDLSVVLRCYYMNKQSLWDSNLSLITQSLNLARNESRGISPFELMFLHKPNSSLSNLWSIHDLLSEKLTVEQKRENLQRAVLNLKKSISTNAKRLRYSVNKTENPIKVGSIVYIKNHKLSSLPNKFNSKLGPAYIGPYRVIYLLSEISVIVQRCDNPLNTRRVTISELKLIKPQGKE